MNIEYRVSKWCVECAAAGRGGRGFLTITRKGRDLAPARKPVTGLTSVSWVIYSHHLIIA